MRSLFRLVAIGVIIAAFSIIGSPSAFAATETYTGSVSFISDAQPPQNINLPSFNTMGGTRTLQSVTVEVIHRGSVSLIADNDDAFHTGRVNGRLMRWWSGAGPGVSTGTIMRTVTTPTVDLGLDNGDGLAVDPTAPDGTNFGGPVSYPDTLAGSYTPSTGLYTSPGPGTVSFTVTPELMTNDLQWVVTPDIWQLQVQNADLTVTVRVSYEYEQSGPVGGAGGAEGTPVVPSVLIGIAGAFGICLIAYVLRGKVRTTRW